MGEPMEMFMEGREVFADLWTAYWTDYEPEHIWVAEFDKKVIGYIFGGIDTRRQEEITFKKMMPKIILKTFVTNCVWSAKTRKYIRYVFRSYRRGELNIPNLSRDYPAHLHTNILDGYRGIGLGKKMMQNWMNHLREHKVPAVHLVTTTSNKIAVPFYKHLGFKTLFEKPITMYEHIVDEYIGMLGMGLSLTENL
jgi:GNAT superfamily N-acetyltransferase